MKESVCTKEMINLAKDAKKGQKKCTESFKICKKAEDASVERIYDCQNNKYEDVGSKVVI